MTVRFLLTIFLLFTSASKADALVVEFRDSAVVDGISVTLADIARFDEDSEFSKVLGSQTVAQAPGPGQEIELTTTPIARYISSNLGPGYAVEWRGAGVVTVKRLVTQISSEKILQIIDEYIQANRTRLPAAEIRFIPSASPLPFLVPAGELSWEVIPSDPGITESSRFSILFRVDDRVRKNMSVKGRLEVLAPVVVAKTALSRGQILTAENITTAVKDIARLREPCRDPQQVIGKKVTRTLKPGSVLLVRQVEFPPVVRKGELVRMFIEIGNLIVTATGVARSDGIMNETIRVQNLRSRKIIYCRVAAPGIVEVAL